ncbi:MAG: pyridoxal-phosphate dependent enzyme [Ketobacter sp. GenoA1]|nr:MAG: pyridoxal-phosphate dependent enzyme [Ketobacter sp. GenoA1]RLT97653.1 MAG: pyridoxal-phosphate dependent enzyme [Ketobacter sp.]
MPIPDTPLSQQVACFETALAADPRLQASGLLATLDIDTLSYALFEACSVQVDVLRADQLHPVVSGNKWFKLKYNLLQAQRDGCRELLSFGGAWSNHLHALAYVGGLLGFKTCGIVRGNELDTAANPMLAEAQALGMELEFVSRQQFRYYREAPRQLAADLRWVIPEGGDNQLGQLGAASMLLQAHAVAGEYSHVVVAVGTGCTFAGLRQALPDSVKLVGVSALKGAWVEQDMARRMRGLPAGGWYLDQAHHFGGFGKVTPDLLSFIRGFGDNTGLLLDPIYTGKAMMALQDLISESMIPCGSRVLFVHSGGLQGRRGFPITH